MRNKILPAAGIIIVTIILLLISEFTELTFVEDYGYILIVVGMLLGVILGKLSEKPDGDN